jgi:hypothetical protein
VPIFLTTPPPTVLPPDDDTCFTADTLILMADGTARPISEIRYDDQILTIAESDHLGQEAKVSPKRAVVERVLRHDTEQAVFRLGGICVTSNHPWAAKANGAAAFVKTEKLDNDSLLRTSEGVFAAAPAVTDASERASVVFNLKTSARTYAVGGSPDGPFFVVHNDKKIDDEDDDE